MFELCTLPYLPFLSPRYLSFTVTSTMLSFTTPTTSRPTMQNTTKFALPSYASLPARQPQINRTSHPIGRKITAPVTSGRKAYNRVRSMLSSLMFSKTVKKTKQTAAVVEVSGRDVRAFGGQSVLGYAKNTRIEDCKVLVPVDESRVSGGQLAPKNANTALSQLATVHIDEHYGWAQVAKTSARFLSTLLTCPETLPSDDLAEYYPDLSHFIASVLYKSCLPLCVHQYAVHLIWRLKSFNPDFAPKHTHGTYLTALMLASKHSYDGEYPISDWASIGQNIFEPSQLRDNEWRMCERLGWKLLVHTMDLVKVARKVEMEYGELNEDALVSGQIEHTESEVGLHGMFANSVASSLSELSTPSSRNLSLPWSDWRKDTPSNSSTSTPTQSSDPGCLSSTPSPFFLP
ncbi:unnamed protein product [Rhizoctonia solani]|uniref:Cyclin N-terminal domain-containing protein n=1 Tax=Rhizoctonia solani TaxID=456999 RepID=A0A8H2XYH8_9AGAM|nr:unnamed protein product [Rhizoctonia solani]